MQGTECIQVQSVLKHVKLTTVCMFVTGKFPHFGLPHMIHILNQHDIGGALIHNLFALTVC